MFILWGLLFCDCSTFCRDLVDDEMFRGHGMMSRSVRDVPWTWNGWIEN